MRNQGDAPAGSASGVCSQDNTPSEPAQQDTSPSGEHSPVSIQAAYAKANLQFVSLCCPTPILESIAIETIIAMDITMGREDLALYWQNFLAKRDPNTGLWQTLSSSNLMSGHVPGYTPSSCFQAEERTNRSLKQGLPRNAHKTSVDQATDFLQAASPFGFFRQRSHIHHMTFQAYSPITSLHVLVAEVELSWTRSFLANYTTEMLLRVVADNARAPMINCYAFLLRPEQG